MLTNNNLFQSVVMFGATGAVGTETVLHLEGFTNLTKLTLLGRRPLKGCTASFIYQENIDIFASESYQKYIEGHQTAICTLGVGEPSKINKEDFVRIDKQAVVDFAVACKAAGVSHFQLLASVAISPESRSFYLRTKGELVEELKALQFERLSIFQPSMILTPHNRYGLSQAITLQVWPILKPLLVFGLRKYRGIPVELLGKAIAANIFTKKKGVEILQWDEFMDLCEGASHI